MSDGAAANPSARAPAAADAGAPARPARDGWIPVLIAAAWGAALLAGMGLLWRYKSTPGPVTEVLGSWPEDSRLPAVGGRPTLVLFAHPECPCTRASIHTLRDLLPHFAERVTICVAALQPEAPPPGWSEEGLRDAVGALPETAFLLDLDGREARRFGAVTSGHVLLYGTNGRLLFSGGITGARGHEGSNPGLQGLERALEAELAGQALADCARAPVFGCELFEPDPSAEGRP